MRTFSLLVLCLMGLFFVACDDDDTRLGDWAKGSAFPGEPRNQAVCFVIGDYAYVGLGIGVNGAEYNNFYKFDRKQGTWMTKPIATFPGRPRHAAVAFVIDGKAYVGLGYRVGKAYTETNENKRFFHDFWEYDPATDSWEEVANYPGRDNLDFKDTVTNDGGGRRDAVAFSFPDDKYGYVGLGRGYNDMVYKEFYSFTPTGTGENGKRGTWKELSVAYPGDGRYGATVFVVDGSAYICLGSTSSSTAVENVKFTPDGNGDGRFEMMQALTEKPNNRQDRDYDRIPRNYGVSFVSDAGRDGQAYGYIATGSGNNGLTVWRYDHTRDRWHQMEDIISGTVAGAVAFSVYNKLGTQQFGMYTTGGGGLDQVLNADVRTDSWWFYPDIKEWRGNDYSTTEVGRYRYE